MTSATRSFLFRLAPGEAHAYMPSGADNWYMYASPWGWPAFGHAGNDLFTGGETVTGERHLGKCRQRTYEAPNNELCGGSGNWENVEMEVWAVV